LDTLTVMSTLGFGDITFVSDAGKIFSILVLLSGVLLLLVILPFTFIQFFYAPWMEAQAKSRAPRELPGYTSNHIIITNFDPLSIALIDKLNFYKRDYVILVEEIPRALELYDMGYKVAVGNLDDPETYSKLQVEKAAMVVAGGGDEINTNVAFTVREKTELTLIVATVNSNDSVDILKLAGSTHVFEFPKMLGRSLARRTVGGDARSNIIGKFQDVIIAEAPAVGTPLVGKTIKESRLRETIGVTIVGIWERGRFEIPKPNSIISNTTVLVLAGNEDKFLLYDELFCIYHASDFPVLILGGGRVGKAAAEALTEKGVDFRIIEKDPDAIFNEEKTVLGNAADIKILEKAGIKDTPSIIITTRDDATNIYLTIYCRRLRPDAQIISRSTLDRNISTLHRAGADLVMSYASLGANTIYNILQKDEVLMLAEGLDVFRMPVPAALVGKTLIESHIREKTNCSVIAIGINGGYNANPDPREPLIEGNELIIIGTVDSERKFIEEYVE
jgi:voltage-gated potassium channel